MIRTAQDYAADASRQYLASVGCIFLCACIGIVPLIVRGNSFGHDFDFHLLSWMETAKQWHEGVVYPHWLASANYGAGEPRFVFYPPASWMLGALLGTLTNWVVAPILFIFIALFFSGMSFYFLAKEWMPEAFACAAACLYTVNPYAIFSAYERSAYGELLAGVWMPPLILFALRRRSSIVPLSLTLAAIWLTNAPAGVMACYTLGALGILSAIMERSLWPMLRVALGILLGIGVSSFFLIPAAYERRWVEIARAVGQGMRVEDSFLFANGGEAFHAAVLRTASWIAVILLSIAVAGVAVIWRKSHAENAVSHTSRITAISALITVGVFLLLLPLSEPLWRVAPEIRFLQFPWRWLLVQSVVTALLSGLALRCFLIVPLRRHWLLTLSLFVFVGLAVYAETSVFFQFEDDDDTLASQLANYRSGLGVEGTDEYTPIDADNSAIQKNLPAVRLLGKYEDVAADSSSQGNPPYQPITPSLAAEENVKLWQAENKLVKITTSTGGFAVLRVMNYPAWRVTVSGQEQGVRPQRRDGLMVVAVPGGTSQIEVTWKATRDVVLGRFVTCISLLLLLPLGFVERRNGRCSQV